MKKLIILMLVLLLTVSLVGCNNEPVGESAAESSVASQLQNSAPESVVSSESSESESNEITPETWGASSRMTAGQLDELEFFYVNFPKYSGYTEGNGLVAEQPDDTMVIVAAENYESPVLNELNVFLPTYFVDIEYTLSKIYGYSSKNYVFNVSGDKAVTIGEYPMHTYEGTFSFDDGDKHNEYQFVVYATQLKSNGAYAYWVVYDISDDQSNGKLIAEHALNMAKTFRE